MQLTVIKNVIISTSHKKKLWDYGILAKLIYPSVLKELFKNANILSHKFYGKRSTTLEVIEGHLFI